MSKHKQLKRSAARDKKYSVQYDTKGALEALHEDGTNATLFDMEEALAGKIGFDVPPVDPGTFSGALDGDVNALLREQRRSANRDERFAVLAKPVTSIKPSRNDVATYFSRLAGDAVTVTTTSFIDHEGERTTVPRGKADNLTTFHVFVYWFMQSHPSITPVFKLPGKKFDLPFCYTRVRATLDGAVSYHRSEHVESNFTYIFTRFYRAKQDYQVRCACRLLGYLNRAFTPCGHDYSQYLNYENVKPIVILTNRDHVIDYAQKQTNGADYSLLSVKRSKPGELGTYTLNYLGHDRVQTKHFYAEAKTRTCRRCVELGRTTGRTSLVSVRAAGDEYRCSYVCPVGHSSTVASDPNWGGLYDVTGCGGPPSFPERPEPVITLDIGPLAADDWESADVVPPSIINPVLLTSRHLGSKAALCPHDLPCSIAHLHPPERVRKPKDMNGAERRVAEKTKDQMKELAPFMCLADLLVCEDDSCDVRGYHPVASERAPKDNMMSRYAKMTSSEILAECDGFDQISSGRLGVLDDGMAYQNHFAAMDLPITPIVLSRAYNPKWLTHSRPTDKAMTIDLLCAAYTRNNMEVGHSFVTSSWAEIEYHENCGDGWCGFHALAGQIKSDDKYPKSEDIRARAVNLFGPHFGTKSTSNGDSLAMICDAYGYDLIMAYANENYYYTRLGLTRPVAIVRAVISDDGGIGHCQRVRVGQLWRFAPDGMWVSQSTPNKRLVLAKSTTDRLAKGTRMIYVSRGLGDIGLYESLVSSLAAKLGDGRGYWIGGNLEPDIPLPCGSGANPEGTSDHDEHDVLGSTSGSSSLAPINLGEEPVVDPTSVCDTPAVFVPTCLPALPPSPVRPPLCAPIHWPSSSGSSGSSSSSAPTTCGDDESCPLVYSTSRPPMGGPRPPAVWEPNIHNGWIETRVDEVIEKDPEVLNKYHESGRLPPTKPTYSYRRAPSDAPDSGVTLLATVNVTYAARDHYWFKYLKGLAPRFDDWWNRVSEEDPYFNLETHTATAVIHSSLLDTIQRKRGSVTMGDVAIAGTYRDAYSYASDVSTKGELMPVCIVLATVSHFLATKVISDAQLASVTRPKLKYLKDMKVPVATPTNMVYFDAITDFRLGPLPKGVYSHPVGPWQTPHADSGDFGSYDNPTLPPNARWVAIDKKGCLVKFPYIKFAHYSAPKSVLSAALSFANPSGILTGNTREIEKAVLRFTLDKTNDALNLSNHYTLYMPELKPFMSKFKMSIPQKNGDPNVRSFVLALCELLTRPSTIDETPDDLLKYILKIGTKKLERLKVHAMYFNGELKPPGTRLKYINAGFKEPEPQKVKNKNGTSICNYGRLFAPIIGGDWAKANPPQIGRFKTEFGTWIVWDKNGLHMMEGSIDLPNPGERPWMHFNALYPIKGPRPSTLDRELTRAESQHLAILMQTLRDYATDNCGIGSCSHGDDMWVADATDGPIHYVEGDISSCDSTHGPCMFAIWDLLFRASGCDPTEIFVQLSTPIIIRNPGWDEYVVLKSRTGMTLYSGSAATTGGNTICTLILMMLYSLYGISAWKNSGYTITYSIAEDIEQTTFLAGFAYPREDGQLEYAMCPSTILRGFGTCPGDFPGPTKLTSDEKALLYLSGIVKGLSNEPDSIIVCALRQRFALSLRRDLQQIAERNAKKGLWPELADAIVSLVSSPRQNGGYKSVPSDEGGDIPLVENPMFLKTGEAIRRMTPKEYVGYILDDPDNQLTKPQALDSLRRKALEIACPPNSSNDFILKSDPSVNMALLRRVNGTAPYPDGIPDISALEELGEAIVNMRLGDIINFPFAAALMERRYGLQSSVL
jgi:hypothetical protein